MMIAAAKRTSVRIVMTSSSILNYCFNSFSMEVEPVGVEILKTPMGVSRKESHQVNGNNVSNSKQSKNV